MRPRTALSFRIRRTTFSFGPSWLLVTPILLATIALVYVPIMAPFASAREAWMMALLLVVGVLLSLVGHSLAHVGAMRVVGRRGEPPHVPIHLFGDAAQVWPVAHTPWREVGAALAGPAISFVLAGLCYAVWDLQPHPYVNVGVLFLALYNAGLTVVNVTPGFPFDGGRLTRALVWGMAGRAPRAIRLAQQLGWALVLLLTIWGVGLIVQRARFGVETGAATLVLVGLTAWALWREPAWKWKRVPAPSVATPIISVIRLSTTGLLIVSMLTITAGVLPVVNGVEAPGGAHTVEPMIAVPPAYRHPVHGNFYLTTVVTQTPILFAQLIHGYLSPVIKVVPPEQIVPPDISPQQYMQQNFAMLEDSETAAKIVALQLAGYDVEIIGQGVQVVNVVAGSPAQKALQPGDVIVRFDGESVETVDELIGLVDLQEPGSTVELAVRRGGEEFALDVPLMPPAATEGAPRIGVAVQTVGTGVVLPFDVEIHPRKIVGGPSAGLLFTLTIYNLITPEDLTKGWPIAGTGTINLDGRVGPIGGVEQKVAAAESAGAAYFLVPPENYADAHRVARHIEVVEVETVDEAIEFLQNLPSR